MGETCNIKPMVIKGKKGSKQKKKQNGLLKKEKGSPKGKKKVPGKYARGEDFRGVGFDRKGGSVGGGKGMMIPPEAVEEENWKTPEELS